MKRYSIMVIENNSDRNEYELCAVDNDPEGIRAALMERMMTLHSGSHTRRVKKYQSVRIQENK